MTSQINYAAINENFPVAGQDNDTQVFRDNFDTIKTGLRYANTEITDLQTFVVRIDKDNNFNEHYISRAVFRDNRNSIFDGGAVSVPFNIDYSYGDYQIYRFGANIQLGFLSFPDNSTSPAGVSKVTLELYGDGNIRTITLDPSNNITYKKNNWPSQSINTFTVQSTVNPVIIEIWKYQDSTIFINYIGEFAQISTPGAGSVQTMFKYIAVAGQTTLAPATVESTLTLTAGNGISLITSPTTNAVTVSTTVGSGLTSRVTRTGTTPTIANGSTSNISIPGYTGYALYKIDTSAAAWVRVYTSIAGRTSDSTRSELDDPTAGSGLIAEVITTGAESVLFSPGTIGFSSESVPTTNIQVAVTNKSGGSAAISVTLTILKLEL